MIVSGMTAARMQQRAHIALHWPLYLANNDIIWAGIVVQLLVPLLHHAALAVICSLRPHKLDARR